MTAGTPAVCSCGSDAAAALPSESRCVCERNSETSGTLPWRNAPKEGEPHPIEGHMPQVQLSTAR